MCFVEVKWKICTEIYLRYQFIDYSLVQVMFSVSYLWITVALSCKWGLVTTANCHSSDGIVKSVIQYRCKLRSGKCMNTSGFKPLFWCLLQNELTCNFILITRRQTDVVWSQDFYRNTNSVDQSYMEIPSIWDSSLAKLQLLKVFEILQVTLCLIYFGFNTRILQL